jgi:prolipoprotein diacylglyceryltransferase
VFGILWAFRKHAHRSGAVFALYLILAGAMRFLVEFWRVNPIVGAGLTEYQWMSAVLVGMGACLLYRYSPFVIAPEVQDP